DYSSAIRILPTEPSGLREDNIEHRGSVTAVFPDHFYSGHYDYVQDRFPPRTHFVLGSDGFYNAFATTSELWVWLQENNGALADAHERESRLAELHRRLHETTGDDDLSFVWVRPPSSTVARANEEWSSERE
ncbi:MAG: hypothetical protein ABFE01_12945, partial [Phycisphaerales bacterium]